MACLAVLSSRKVPAEYWARLEQKLNSVWSGDWETVLKHKFRPKAFSGPLQTEDDLVRYRYSAEKPLKEMPLEFLENLERFGRMSSMELREAMKLLDDAVIKRTSDKTLSVEARVPCYQVRDVEEAIKAIEEMREAAAKALKPTVIEKPKEGVPCPMCGHVAEGPNGQGHIGHPPGEIRRGRGINHPWERQPPPENALARGEIYTPWARQNGNDTFPSTRNLANQTRDAEDTSSDRASKRRRTSPNDAPSHLPIANSMQRQTAPSNRPPRPTTPRGNAQISVGNTPAPPLTNSHNESGPATNEVAEIGSGPSYPEK